MDEKTIRKQIIMDIKFKIKFLLGYNNGEPIYLSPPSWDCGWSWGFGYIGNRNCHYHIDGLALKENTNLKDAIDKHFGESYVIRPSHRWTIAELFKNFYDLKNAAYILGKGGSHLTTSPSQNIIKNVEEANRINEVALPHVFNEIYKILKINKDNEKLFKELVNIDNQGLTSVTLDFMKENNIHPDDLKTFEDNDKYNYKYIEGLNKYDFNRIHGAWYKDYHANKNKK